MISASPTAVRSVRTSPSSDRRFYSGMAIAMAVVVFVGFGPTFYLRPFVPDRPTVSGATDLSALAMLHGLLFSAWVVLFIVQTALVAGHRVSLHRRLGVAGAGLAAAMVLVGISTAIASAARGGAPPGVDPLTFLAVPLFDMVVFPIFVIAALLKRRDREAHKRLMLLAYITIIVAAVARWPGVLPYGPFVFFGLGFVFLLLGIVYDLVTRRRVHPVYMWGGALLVASVPVRLAISGTEAWRVFAEFVTR
jgi:hypothetical protein